MKYKIALAQGGSCDDFEKNLAWSSEAVKKAVKEEASMVVFPECFMATFAPGVEASVEIGASQPLDGPFVKGMQKLAAENGVWVIFGMHEPADETHNYNTTVVLDAEGNIVSTYHKTHLFDAFRSHESDRIAAGDKLFEPIDTPFGKIGIFVCYELRFPEVARFETFHGADLLIIPAAWVRGKGKNAQLRNSVIARAMENTVYAVMCDKCEGICIGESVVVDPFGAVVAEMGSEPDVMTVEIDTEVVAKARQILPILENRREDLY